MHIFVHCSVSTLRLARALFLIRLVLLLRLAVSGVAAESQERRRDCCRTLGPFLFLSHVQKLENNGEQTGGRKLKSQCFECCVMTQRIYSFDAS